MSFQIEGKLIAKWDTEKKTESFSVRKFAIETPGEYPQQIMFQAAQDRCDLIDNFQKDQVIRVHFDLRGRKWNDTIITNLNAWKIEAVDGQQAQPAAQNAALPTQEEAAKEEVPDGDLPF